MAIDAGKWITPAGVITAGVLVAVVVVLWNRKAIANAAGAAVDAVNPASSDNLINRGVSAIGAAVSGDPDWSLGSWVYDLTHPSEPTTSPAAWIQPRMTTGDFARLDRPGTSAYGQEPYFDPMTGLVVH